jgi:hypothetical protein
MNELKNNIEKLSKQVNSFSSYVSKKDSDNGSTKNIFSKTFEKNGNKDDFLLSKLNINMTSKRSTLIMLSIPIVIFFILFTIKPKILLKRNTEEDIIAIDITKLIIFSLILSAFIIIILLKKTSLFS